MKINVVLLGQYRLAATAHEFVMELPHEATAEVAVSLMRIGGNHAIIPARPVVAINHIQGTLDQILRDGDELALLPPVAGG
jgi:molybdopterin converting factor small subunit